MRRPFLFIFLFFALSTAHAAVLSETTITQNCSPKRSNDCQMRDAVVIAGQNAKFSWQGLKIKSQNLPKNSWYRIEQNDTTEFSVVVYPDVGPHYILGHHDFGVKINIKNTAEPETSAVGPKCIIPSADTELQKFTLADKTITISSFLNYYYDGPPYSNPNPYTPEVEAILKAVRSGLKIGHCP